MVPLDLKIMWFFFTAQVVTHILAILSISMGFSDEAFKEGVPRTVLILQMSSVVFSNLMAIFSAVWWSYIAKDIQDMQGGRNAESCKAFISVRATDCMLYIRETAYIVAMAISVFYGYITLGMWTMIPHITAQVSTEDGIFVSVLSLLCIIKLFETLSLVLGHVWAVVRRKLCTK